MTPRIMNKLSEVAERQWSATSIPAKFLVWLAPILFTAGMMWVSFRDLPMRVSRSESDIIVLGKESALGKQERGQMKEALGDIKVILKEIRDDQREQIKTYRSRNAIVR